MVSSPSRGARVGVGYATYGNELFELRRVQSNRLHNPLTDSGGVRSGGAKFQQGGFVSGSLLDPGT